MEGEQDNSRGLVARFSVTSRCQRECSFCTPSTTRDLSRNQIEEILTACVAVGVRTVHWTGGEPTLRTDIVQLVERARTLGMTYQKMTTNGVLLTKLASRLVTAGLDRVNVSHMPETGVGDGLMGLNRLIREGIELTSSLCPVKVNVCLTKDTIEEILPLVDFAAKYPLRIVLKFLELVPCHNQYERDTDLFESAFVSIAEALNTIKRQYTVHETSSLPHSRAKCRYYQIAENGVVFGLNPNRSIGYACQKRACKDIRINPAGHLSDCSVRIDGMVHLAACSLQDKIDALRGVMSRKLNRTDEEWARYEHRQRYYAFWRFGAPLGPLREPWM